MRAVEASSLPSSSLGVTLGAPIADLPAVAKAVEGAGFDTVWLAETTHTAVVQAAVCAQATQRIGIGLNIALAFPTAPAAQAMLAWDLAELSANRFILGLGSQVRRIVEDRFGVDFDPPARADARLHPCSARGLGVPPRRPRRGVRGPVLPGGAPGHHRRRSRQGLEHRDPDLPGGPRPADGRDGDRGRGRAAWATRSRRRPTSRASCSPASPRASTPPAAIAATSDWPRGSWWR